MDEKPQMPPPACGDHEEAEAPAGRTGRVENRPRKNNSAARDPGTVSDNRGIDDRQRVGWCPVRPFPISGEIGKTSSVRRPSAGRRKEAACLSSWAGAGTRARRFRQGGHRAGDTRWRFNARPWPRGAAVARAETGAAW